MKTVPPATAIQKVEVLLPAIFSALHVYLPESSNRARRIVKVLLLVRFTPSLVQSISGVGKPLKEHLNSSDELYVTDWFLISGFLPGGPGHRINKKNLKRAKVWKKKKTSENERSNRRNTTVGQNLPVTVMWKADSFFPSLFLALHVIDQDFHNSHD